MTDGEADLSLLRPKVRRLAEALCEACKAAGFEIRIVRAFRSNEQQEEYYAQGRTRAGEIITHARGGESLHNYGVAFDIAPVHFKDADEKLSLRNRAGHIGESLGLEWGGRWEEFIDPPHFQYTAGYSLADFQNDAIDWSKFD